MSIEIKNLVVDYGNFKTDVTLCVPRGCVTGLVGRNGAGKSTLIRAIMRQQDATGSILYGGKPFRGNETEILNKIACVFDKPHYNIMLTPVKLLKLFKSVYHSFDEEMYYRLMSKFELDHNLKVSKFSLGMQRKYSLILALCMRPEILVLDEPTSGIDPLDRSVIVELIQEFMLDESHTVLLSTHITEDLDRIADYIAIMNGGKILLAEQKDVLIEEYRLVQSPVLTEEMKSGAIGLQKSMMGYTFLTRDKNLSGENISVKIPSVEEIFIHTVGGGDEQ